MKVTPVILSGGSGTRPWPVSRRLYPKQLLPLVNDTTLFQNAINRVANHDVFSPALLIANEDHRFIVAEQVREIEAEVSEIILEPMGWNDIGSWSALWGISEVDDDGNALQGEVVSINNKNCLIRSEGVDISAIGVHGLIIVSTKNAVLVADKSNVQDVKKVVDRLRERGSEKPDFHTLVHRPSVGKPGKGPASPYRGSVRKLFG